MKFSRVHSLLLGSLALVAGALGMTLFLQKDPEYFLSNLLAFGRFNRYDQLIETYSQQRGMDPALTKAVIWRESRFQPHKTGSQGERGLMQITEKAASDWARVEKIETFVPTDLFDPKVNIEVGTWYLSKALNHWANKDDPLPFALAEYNAGRTRVRRWMKDSGREEDGGASDLQAAMDFPGTKNYITSILARQAFYKESGEFQKQQPAR